MDTLSQRALARRAVIMHEAENKLLRKKVSLRGKSENAKLYHGMRLDGALLKWEQRGKESSCRV